MMVPTGRPCMALRSQNSVFDAPPRTGLEPVFSVQQLAARTGQHGEALRDFAVLLLNHLPAERDALRDAVRSRALDAIAPTAHKLAGSFAALAIDSLVTDALAIEVAASAGDLPHCAELFRALDKRCSQVVNELSRFVASFGSS